MTAPAEYPLLDAIQGPDDVKRLSPDQMVALAEEIRHKLVHCIARTGGHLGPNLGVVELTIALHAVFDTPKDKFVFDVSHQGYVHKMLTGRNERIHTIRQFQGLSGFLLHAESAHDAYGSGHAGTALSAALGMAVARDLAGTDEHVVCIAGDAAFTCGPTFEALNNVGSTKRLIVVLNDNGRSIDKNVGAIARYFHNLVTSGAYSSLRQKTADLMEKLGGKAARRIVHRLEESAKNVILPSVLFEEFGLRYFGPVDGHDLPALIQSFRFLRKQQEPVLLHVITEKGRGYEPALANPGKFHGLGPYQVETGETQEADPTASDVFARTLTDLGHADSQIVAITAAMPGGTKLEVFQKEIPARYFDVGIAEEHAAIFACGLASKGFKPFLAIYSTFMQRAFDMILHDMATQRLPVRLCMDRAGLSGDDGPTHHGLFDIAFLRPIPGLVLMQPRDENELADMLWTMAGYNEGPIAVRYPRGPIAGQPVAPQRRRLEIGKAEVVAEGTEVALFGLGTLFPMAAETRALLEAEGISTALVDPRFVKPLDTAVLERFARQCAVLCTFEDHALADGFGCAVIEHLHEAGIHCPVVRIGWPDRFIEHGTVPVLRERHGLAAGHAVARIRQALAESAPRPR